MTTELLSDQQYLKTHYLEMTRLTETGDLESAQLLCRRLVADRPQLWPPCIWLANMAMDAGAFDEGRSHIQTAKKRGAPELGLARPRLAMARKTGDVPAQLRELELLVLLEPGNPQWWRQALVARIDAGLGSDAFDSLGKLLELNPKAAVNVELQALAGQMEARVFVDRISDLIAGGLDLQSLRVARAMSLAGCDRMASAWEDIEAACRMSPDTNLSDQLQLAIENQICKSAEHQMSLEALRERNPGNAPLLWCLVKVLDKQGEIDRVRSLVQENWSWAQAGNPPLCAYLWGHGQSRMETRAQNQSSRPIPYQELLLDNRVAEALEIAPSASAKALLHQRMGLPDTGYSSLQPNHAPGEVIVAGPERPNGTVVVFTGLGDQASVPIHVLDGFFAHLGLTAIYLRDFSRLLFLNGVKGLGPSLESSLSALSEKLASVGAHKPLYTMGNSAGGMAAIVYGAALGAASTLVFSPPTTLDPRHHEEMGDTRGRLLFKRLLATLDHTAFDIAAILSRTPEPYLVTAYAGAGNHADRAHAKRLAAMPRTRVHLLDGVETHDSLPQVASERGLLNVILDAFRIRQDMSLQ